MCGRYTANTEDEVIEIRRILAGLSMRLIGDSLTGDIHGKEVFPSDTAPVINKDGVLTLSKWGFEKWDGNGLIINARSETASTGRFFSPYVKKGRCIVPASSYFEWRKSIGSPSVKYRIGLRDSCGIFMAGLLKHNNDTGNFVVLTKEPEDNISFIHNRMPVLLTHTQIIPWLDGSLDPVEMSQSSVRDIFFEKAV
ncbi:MAG: SOS response-associated peptidase [Firmicutes bacterium HGW-Firmicutes-21]|nr:MAG: SOS response-associated peptidase [Firmicutes bacterium HGW-Firmicutes-21]